MKRGLIDDSRFSNTSNQKDIHAIYCNGLCYVLALLLLHSVSFSILCFFFCLFQYFFIFLSILSLTHWLLLRVSLNFHRFVNFPFSSIVDS